MDWKASNFSPSEKFDYYRYKKFGILPKFQYQIDDLHVVEKYVKENQGK
ncbi:hypothetical protein [Staphylococcus sp. HMSC068D08]